MRLQRFLPILLALCCALPLHGCGPRDLVGELRIAPDVISPNADGDTDVAEIHYSVSRLAFVSMYLLDKDGGRHDLRVRERRSQGERTVYFGGVIGGTLLPDGEYRVVMEAEDREGRTGRAEATITLVDGDRQALSIDNLTVWPNSFTPNRDGIGDRVSIGYSLSKEAARVDVYLLGPDGAKHLVPADKIREPGARGSHEHDYDAGIDMGAAPPPNGDYTVVVYAVDAVGNEARVQGTLRIEGGGVPLVEIVNRAATFSPSVVALGGTVYFTCTVKNIGTVPVRTTGPASGTVYTTSQNFNTLQAYEEPGAFRIGLDYEGNSAGRNYPFRWQLGTDAELTPMDTGTGMEHYLMPGQSVTVSGGLTIVDEPPKTEPYYWIGLIHESVEIVQDRVGAVPIAVGF